MADITATEIRCEEKTKSSIKYEVILAEPAAAPPAALKTPTDSHVPRSSSIEEKLRQAEERRSSLEAEKIAKAARRSKIEEVAKKRTEEENEYREATKETMEKRLETSSERRESLINEKMDKLKDHDRRVEEARLKKEKLGENKENGCEVTPSG